MIENPTLSPARWSQETILDLIRKVRNDLIKDFLDERFLLEYLSSSYRMKELSVRKLEFLRAELKEMLIRPVDIGHYETLIRQISETDSASISAGNEALFYKEIESVLKKHIY